MDLELSAEQQQLGESVRRFLADRAPTAWVRSMLDDDRGTTDDVWAGLVDLGAVDLLAAGASMVDVGVVAEELGRAVHPGPWLSTAVAGATLVPDLVAEGRVVAVAFDGIDMVADGCAADVVVVVDGDRVRAHDTFTATPVATVDGTRKWAAVSVEGDGSPLEGADAALARDRLLATLVADGVGTGARALELAVEYAKERHQFGRPIGSFQAVQHLCADMLQRVELARAGALYALWACDASEPAERRRAVAMAKAYASEALPKVGADAIQVHGGIGFTWEHDVHLFHKRLLTLAQAYGGPESHLEDLARLTL